MDCTVIAISRALGAGGEQVGAIVARELGFRYVDNDIIEKAAATVGVSPQTIGQVERTEPLIVRIFSAMGASSMDAMAVSPEVMPMPAYTRGYMQVIEQVIRQTAAEGKAVIVAHGASIPLAGTPGLLRIFMTASPAVRAARIAQESTLDEKDALKAIEDSDNQRAQFLRRFYDVRRELPTHYDLVISTDVLSSDEAAKLVLAAARG